MKKAIRHTFRFTQSPAEVWEYLTNPDLIELWLMKSDFKLELGHKFRFMGGCNHEDADSREAASCEVLEIQPNARLVYSWVTSSLNDEKPYTSTVTWTLRPDADGTELQLLHDGFMAIEDLSAHNDGWTRIGNKLAEKLNALSYECTQA
ncbi:MAG: SRPBCC domain-containing protein [Chitinophagaceae bacterium]|nr:SRPBCC domain-containing protein [Chitinophagaceae bacterium]